MKLDVESLTTGLTYHGRVEGKRQRYFVLSDPRRAAARELFFNVPRT